MSQEGYDHLVYFEQPKVMPWQCELYAQWIARNQNDQLPHALLLAGPSGVGKRQFAASLIAYLFCQQPDDQGSACGHCEGCKLMQNGSHGDFRWISVLPDKKLIGIDQVRDGIGFLQKTSAYGTRKILVLEPAEKMTVNTANALLKSLEEPPGNALIILVTEALGRLSATIKSRCQRVDFQTPSYAEAERFLSDVLGASGDIPAALNMSSNRPLAALSLLQSELLDESIGLYGALEQVLKKEVSFNSALDGLAKIEPLRLAEVALKVVSDKIKDAASGSRTLEQYLFERYTALRALERVLRSSANPARDIAQTKVLMTLAGK